MINNTYLSIDSTFAQDIDGNDAVAHYGAVARYLSLAGHPLQAIAVLKELLEVNARPSASADCTATCSAPPPGDAPAAPVDADFADAAVWRIKLPADGSLTALDYQITANSGRVLSLQLRHSLRSGERSRGSGQLDWMFPIRGALHGYLQVFSGHGERRAVRMQDAGVGDEADAGGHRERQAANDQRQHAAGQGQRHAAEDQQRIAQAAEGNQQQHEDRRQGDRCDQHQARIGRHQLFVGAAIGQPDTGRQAQVAIDLSGRAYFTFDGKFDREFVGEMPTELVAHFFRSVSDSLLATLQMSVKGDNTHHMVETLFKVFGRALRPAIARGAGSEIPSTKGVL